MLWLVHDDDAPRICGDPTAISQHREYQHLPPASAIRYADRDVGGKVLAWAVSLPRPPPRVKASLADALNVRFCGSVEHETNGLILDGFPSTDEAIVERRARSRVGVFCDGAAS